MASWLQHFFACKYDFCQFVKSWFLGFLVPVNLFRHFGVLEMNPCRVNRTLLLVKSFTEFWQPENTTPVGS
jgi:hypothetical protein